MATRLTLERLAAIVEGARRYIAERLLAAHVSADAMSIAGVVICALAGAIIWKWHVVGVGAAVFLVGASCDFIDGAIARMTVFRPGYENGPMVDCVCDKLGELSFMTGLALACNGSDAVRVLALAASLGLLTSYVKAASAECGLALEWTDVRVVGRTGRVIILGVGLVLTTLAGLGVDEAVIVVAGLLSLFNACTLIVRIRKVIRRGGAPRLRVYRTRM